VSPSSKSSGSWDSIHVFEAQDKARRAKYKLTSTVILNLGNSTDTLGAMDLSGNMVRQIEMDMPVEDESSHVANVGRMVEDMEGKMRNLLRKMACCCIPMNLTCTAEEVYFGKAKDVVGDLRSTYSRLSSSALANAVQVLHH